MIISGKDIEFLGMVEGAVWEGQFQPAGADLTVESIHLIENCGEIDGDNSMRKLPECKKIEWENGKIKLERGAYKVVFNETVSVPANAAGIARSRSSLLRMGAFVATAVWDPGYKGRSEALLVVENTHGINVHEDAKLAQIVFIRLEKEAENKYCGQYQGENLEPGDDGKYSVSALDTGSTESEEERRILDSL